MTPRQARRERREAERKAKKLELKKSRQASGAWSSATANRQASAPPLPGLKETARQASGACSPAAEEFSEIQPRWNPELEDEFPREVQIRNNAIMDRRLLEAGLPIPPPGPTAGPRSDASAEEIRDYYRAKRAKRSAENPAILRDFVPTTAPAPRPQPPAETDEFGFVSQNTPSPAEINRAAINRANAQFSTGPRSSPGKSASSRNLTKHGLASGTVIIPGEDPAAFEALLTDLLEEHQPATVSEEILINEMAQSHWLTQRAIRFQNDCFTAEGVDQKQLALFLRYQTTHERRFYKALSALLKLKKIGFVSQPSPKSVTAVGFVSQTNIETHPDDQFISQNPPVEVNESPSELKNAKRAA